jgi:hypothetical protein
MVQKYEVLVNTIHNIISSFCLKIKSLTNFIYIILLFVYLGSLCIIRLKLENVQYSTERYE